MRRTASGASQKARDFNGSVGAIGGRILKGLFFGPSHHSHSTSEHSAFDAVRISAVAVCMMSPTSSIAEGEDDREPTYRIDADRRGAFWIWDSRIP
jgi:hypothetical protein